MVIVIGTFRVAPQEREAYIAGRLPAMHRSRLEEGCITYAFTADPIEPGTVVLTERWTNRAALDAHIAAMRSAPPSPQGVAALSHEIHVYEADDGTPL